MNRKTRRALIGVLLVIFIVSTTLTVRDIVRSRREKAANDSLAEEVHRVERQIRRDPQFSPSTAKTPSPIDLPLSPYGETGVLLQYEPLYLRNNDMAGWLTIPGTAVDYPVMYTPDNIEKYLRSSFDGSYALSGTLFLGAGWSPESNYGIIFGHHMRDGSMFGGLVSYADPDYYAQHSTLRFDTLTEQREYEVVAAFYSRVYTNKDHDVFRYYQYTDLSDEATFREYVTQCRAAALYDTGIVPEYGDRLLALSTCNYHTKNGRFVLLARQITDEG